MKNNRAPEPTDEDISRASKAKAKDVYEASDGKLTVAFYRRLSARGPIGIIAMNLMRAQKTSSRAKVYRGRQYRNASYDTKNYSIDQLCVALEKDSCGIKWGFGRDESTPGYPWVVYADLPEIGQVSFHTDHRGDSRIWPNYEGTFDGAKGMSESRILDFCDAVLRCEVAS